MKGNVFLILLLLLFQNIIISQNADSNKNIRELTNKALNLSSEVKELSWRNDSLSTLITHLNNEITLYKTGLKYPEKGLLPIIKPQSLASPQIIVPTKPNHHGDKNDIQSKSLVDAANKSKQDISNLNKKVRVAQGTISKQKKDIGALAKEISDLNKLISEQQIKSKSLVADLADLETILNCIKKFESEINRPTDEVVSDLVKTRSDYQEYKRLLRIKSLDIVKKTFIINKVMNVYESYKGKEKEMNCGGIRFSVYQDYLNNDDYMNIAEIYGKNYGNSITSLDSTNQINEANRRILDASGKILEGGNYDQRTMTINNLPSYITEERMGKTDNSEVKGYFRKIVTAFYNGRYLESLTAYDKIQKFKTLEFLIKEKPLLDEVEYCVGSILLWDLGAYGDNITDIIIGDWLDSGDIKQVGFGKLNSLVDDKNTNLKIRKQASLAINKYYE